MPLCHIGLCGHAHPHDLENNKYMWCLSTEKFPAARLPPESRASSDEVPKWQSWKELGIKFGWRRNFHHQATKSRKVAGRRVHSRMQKWREPVSGVWSEDGKVYFGDSWERRPIQKHTSVTAGKRQAVGKFLKEIIFLAEDKRWLIVDLYSSIWNIFIGKAPLFETTTKKNKTQWYLHHLILLDTCISWGKPPRLSADEKSHHPAGKSIQSIQVKIQVKIYGSIKKYMHTYIYIYMHTW